MSRMAVVEEMVAPACRQVVFSPFMLNGEPKTVKVRAHYVLDIIDDIRKRRYF